MSKKRLNPGIIVFLALLLLFGSMGCSAAQASSQTAYVTVTPTANEVGVALPAANSLRSTATSPVIAMARILTPPATPNVDYLATSIAGSTATVVKAIEINNYQASGRESEQGKGEGNSSSTATPLPTGTPAHLPTGAPTPTRTPTPQSGPAAVVSIQNAQFTNCAETLTTDLTVSGATNLQGFAFKLRFDPAIVQVIDADPGQDGTQISLGSAFSGGQNFIAVNKVDQSSGLIDFAAVMVGSNAFNGQGVLAQIQWQPRQGGSSALRLENVELATSGGGSQPAQTQNGQAQVPAECN